MNDSFTYAILAVLSFLGLYCGLFAGYFAKEELDPGRLYLNRLYYLILVSVLVLFLLFNPSLVFLLGVPVLFIAFSFSKYREILYYYASALLLGLSFLYNGFIVICTLVFLLGFPLGSVHLLDNIDDKENKPAKSLFFKYSPFLIISLGFLLVQILL